MQPNSPCVCLERQRCALWIRKLCEPSGTGTGIPGRKNRNLYAKLLLHMLRRGVLEGPFTQRPEPGTLRALPSYMVGVCAPSALLPMPRRGRPRALPPYMVGVCAKRLTVHAQAGAPEGPVTQDPRVNCSVTSPR